MKSFPPYVLRHTSLTNLTPNVDPFTLQTIAGHSSITMTQRYGHPQAEVIVQGFDKLASRQEVVTEVGHLGKWQQKQRRVGAVVKLSFGKS